MDYSFSLAKSLRCGYTHVGFIFSYDREKYINKMVTSSLISMLSCSWYGGDRKKRYKTHDSCVYNLFLHVQATAFESERRKKEEQIKNNQIKNKFINKSTKTNKRIKKNKKENKTKRKQKKKQKQKTKQNKTKENKKFERHWIIFVIILLMFIYKNHVIR